LNEGGSHDWSNYGNSIYSDFFYFGAGAQHNSGAIRSKVFSKKVQQDL